MPNRRIAMRPHWRLIITITLAISVLGWDLFPVSTLVASPNKKETPRNQLSQFTFGGTDKEIDTKNSIPVETNAAAPVDSSEPVCNDEGLACIWEDDATSGPLGCRVPLIFVHGIHGNDIGKADTGCYQGKDTEDDPRRLPNTCYFKSLITQLSSSGTLSRDYKIYRFHYKSDVKPVTDLGTELGKLLDRLIQKEPNFDQDFTIVAHSMGGLVARAYMNLFRHASGVRYKGRFAGDRVSKLITLGTPHHGTKLSNGKARTQDVFFSSPWAAVFRGLDRYAWDSVACLTYLSSCLKKPNRADLHWDDYDGSWKNRPIYQSDPAEQNSLLKILTSSRYDHKIYPYFGYIGDGKLFGREGRVLEFGKANPANLAFQAGVLKDAYQHQALIVTGVILERIERDNFALKVPLLPEPASISNLFNDGMVSFQSASFAGRSDRTKTRSCIGYDHLDMRDGSPFPCRAGSVEKPMVQLLLDDLRLDSTPTCPRAVVSKSLVLSPASVYSVGRPINGTFSITNRGTGNLFMKRVVIGGRRAGICPGGQCPDFAPAPGNITLRPNESYNYSGSFTPSQTGNYTFSVAYENAEDKWTMPVEAENGNKNQLNITVTSVQPNVVVSKSLTILPGSGPLPLGQTVNGTFSITNRGNAPLTMRQVIIGGRLGGNCPNKVCPDFSPISPNITLNPGQTFDYSGRITLTQAGSYTFYVAYQTPDEKWEIPVKSERGAINQLSVLVQPPGPVLTKASPTSVAANANAQSVNLYGLRLAKVIYAQVRLPNGSITYLYIPLNQVFRVNDGELRINAKFTTRGTHYIRVWTADGKSNEFPIVVF